MREDIKINETALRIEKPLIEKLEAIYDPDIELDIYNLGLIYELNLNSNGHLKVTMTFTDTACNCTDTVPQEIIDSLITIPEVTQVSVEVVWKPVWKMTRISRFGRIALGISPK